MSQDLLKDLKLRITEEHTCTTCGHVWDDTMCEYYQYLYDQGVCPYCGQLLPKICQTVTKKDYTK